MTDCIELILINLAATFGGNFGWAIAFLSLAIRLALLPVALRAAKRRQVLARLAPEVEAIRRNYQDPAKKILELYRKNGLSLWDWTLLVVLAQIPLVLSLNAAIARLKPCQFLWIRDLTKPDAYLVIACGALAALAPPDHRQGVMAALFTCVFLWKMSAGAALYSLASGLVGIVQARLEKRYS